MTGDVSYLVEITYKYIYHIYWNSLIYYVSVEPTISVGGGRDRDRGVSDKFIHSELIPIVLSASSKDKQYTVKPFSSPDLTNYTFMVHLRSYPGLTSILPGCNVHNLVSVPILKIRIIALWPLFCFLWSLNISSMFADLIGPHHFRTLSLSWTASCPARPAPHPIYPIGHYLNSLWLP